MKIGINVSYAALVTGTRSAWALFFKTLSFLSSDFERNNENFRKISVLVRLQGTTHWTAWNALLWFWTSEITGKYYKLLHIRVYTAPVYECSCVLLEYCFVQSSFLSLKILPLIVPWNFFQSAIYRRQRVNNTCPVTIKPVIPGFSPQMVSDFSFNFSFPLGVSEPW